MSQDQSQDQSQGQSRTSFRTRSRARSRVKIDLKNPISKIMRFLSLISVKRPYEPYIIYIP